MTKRPMPIPRNRGRWAAPGPAGRKATRSGNDAPRPADREVPSRGPGPVTVFIAVTLLLLLAFSCVVVTTSQGAPGVPPEPVLHAVTDGGSEEILDIRGSLPATCTSPPVGVLETERNESGGGR